MDGAVHNVTMVAIPVNSMDIGKNHLTMMSVKPRVMMSQHVPALLSRIALMNIQTDATCMETCQNSRETLLSQMIGLNILDIRKTSKLHSR